jgi:hypothetical protein
MPPCPKKWGAEMPPCPRSKDAAGERQHCGMAAV